MPFNGLQLVPAVLVGPVRSLLASQGITNAISDSGEVDPLSLVALGFQKLEIRTALSPPVVIDLTKPTDPKAEEQMRFVQPAIILSGRAGTATIAPFGVPLGISPEVKKWALSAGVGLGAALVGVILFGAAFGRRSAR